MRSSFKVIVGSLVGSLVVYAAVASCGGPNANAQTSPCASWEVATFGAVNTTGASGVGLSPTVSVPAGWEPIGLTPYGFSQSSGVLVSLRRCVQ